MANNPIIDKNTLKNWFKRGLKPLEVQFHAWMDSYWHKSEEIPTSSVQGLENVLNQKAESITVENLSDAFNKHMENNLKHKKLEEQNKLDNLADNPNLTYATRDELNNVVDNPDVIIIPVDMRIPDFELNTANYIKELFQAGDTTLFEKPVYLKYIWKEDYTTENAPEYILLVKGELDLTNKKEILFNSPVKFTDIDFPDESYAYCAKIYTLRDAFTIRFDSYREDTDVLVFKMRDIPPGDPEIYPDSNTVWLGNIRYFQELGKAVEAKKKGRKVMYTLLSSIGSCIVSLNVKSGVLDRSKTIVELRGSVPIITETAAIQKYCFSIISDEFLYVDSDSIKSVWAKCYMHIIKEPDKSFVLTVDNTNMSITNPNVMGDYAKIRKLGANPILYLKYGEIQLLHPMYEAVSDTNIFLSYNIPGLPNKYNSSDPINNKMLYTMFTVVGIKNGDTWECHVEKHDLEINVYDYLKVSNIHVVTEYPTDLSNYPEGSIFIKTIL